MGRVRHGTIHCMPNYRRHYVPGGTFFFTVVTEERRPLLVEHRTLLRNAIEECRRTHPFEIVAAVLLPDHLHAVWTLAVNDTDYSTRWSIIKRRFSQMVDAQFPQSPSRTRNRRLGVWQRRFWEHWVRDENELIEIVEYIHFNPVKHQLVRCPHEWAPSSFHRYVRESKFEANWMCACDRTPAVERFFDPKWDSFEC